MELAASDDEGARAAVLGLAREIGFDSVHAAPFTTARWLQSLGHPNIQLGFMLKMNTQIGFALVH